MPGGDGRGFDGRGGFCTPLLESGQIKRPLQRGIYGRGRGFGRGFAWRAQSAYPVRESILTKEEEKKILEAELAEIKAETQEIEKRLKELG